MNLRSKFKNLIVTNNKGLGIIGVMVAAALVIVAAFTVATFVSDQWRQSMRLEISGSCQNIANTIAEYIKKDESSLFITSFGPRNMVSFTNAGSHPSSPVGSSQYPPGLSFTDDGYDSFVFGGTAINAYSGTGGVITGGNLNPNWSFFNHYNIRNSSNRLVSLASNGFCCTDLNINEEGGGCNALYYSDNVPRPGFVIRERDVEVYLGVNVTGVSCLANNLLASNVPNSRYAGAINFKVRVVMNRNFDNKRICEATGSVQKAMDTDASLTLMQYENLGAACNSPELPVPSYCGAPATVSFRAKTVLDTPACRSNCLGNVVTRTCGEIDGGALSIFNTINPAHSACAAATCPDSEPGAVFLCKVAEATTTFNTATPWEPCERATVKDAAGAVIPGTAVRIEYVAGTGGSMRTTEARVTVSGLPAGRGFFADIRSVDTAGNLGPSFCSFSSSCEDPTRPHFTVVSDPPAPGPITDSANYVMTIPASGVVNATAVNSQIGRVTTVTNNATFQAALQPVGNETYQCAAGEPQFRLTTGTIVTGDYCTASHTVPAGGSINRDCLCSSGVCYVTMPAVNAIGLHRLSIQVNNACGSAPSPQTIEWCVDTDPNIDITTANTTFTLGPNINFSVPQGYVVYNNLGSKNCGRGLISLDPRVGAAPQPTLRTNAAPFVAPTNWNTNNHSGCVQDPASNLCIMTIDPCGRFQNSEPAQYSSYLATGNGTSNECFRNAANTPVSGNRCDLPDGNVPYCTRDGKCSTQFTNTSCMEHYDCIGASQSGVSPLSAGGSRCVGGQCTRPTNKLSPIQSASTCGERYCPQLNSCFGVSIGSSSNTADCLPCTHWAVTPWSACSAAGQQTRTYSCPGPAGSCACHPVPPTTRPCPACGSAVSAGPTEDPPTTGLCTPASATPSTPALVGGNWTWTCSLPGYSDVSCTVGYLAPVNGSCGPAAGYQTSAPVGDFCSAGTFLGPVTGGPPWDWECQGSGSGSNSNCRAHRRGQCNAATVAGGPYSTPPANRCTYTFGATPTPVLNGAGNAWEWICRGSNTSGVTDDVSCSAPATAPPSGCSAGTTWQFSYSDSYGQSDSVCSHPLCSSIEGTTIPSPYGAEHRCVDTHPGTCCTDSSICIGNFNVYTCQSTGCFNGYIEFGSDITSSSNLVCSQLDALIPTRVGQPMISTNSGSFFVRTSTSSNTWTDVTAALTACSASLPLGLNQSFSPTINNSWLGGPVGNPPTSLCTINGVCGPANGGSFANAGAATAAGLCTSGTPSSTPSGPGPWSWVCNGSGGGTNSPTCTATRNFGLCLWQMLFPYDGGPGFNCVTPPDAASCDAFGLCNSASHGQSHSPVSGCVNVACECNCPSGCTVNGQPSTEHTCNGIAQAFSGDSSCCSTGSFCSGLEPIGTPATCGSPAVFWHVGTWGPCSASSCGANGTETRVVECRNSFNQVIADALCLGLGPKPDTTRACYGSCASGSCEYIVECTGPLVIPNYRECCFYDACGAGSGYDGDVRCVPGENGHYRLEFMPGSCPSFPMATLCQ